MKLTSIVVCTNESEYCHNTTSLMARTCPKTAILWLRLYVLVIVLRTPPITPYRSPENCQFYGLREGALGEYVVQARVRAYAAKEMRFFGCVRSYSICTNVLSEYSLPHPKNCMFSSCVPSYLVRTSLELSPAPRKHAVFWDARGSTWGVRYYVLSTSVRSQRTAVFWHDP